MRVKNHNLCNKLENLYVRMYQSLLFVYGETVSKHDTMLEPCVNLICLKVLEFVFVCELLVWNAYLNKRIFESCFQCNMTTQTGRKYKVFVNV